MYQLFLHPKAEKNLHSIPSDYREKIYRAIDDIVEHPFLAGKRLSGVRRDHYSARVGLYRIIYRIEKKILVIIIIGIGYRKDVYRD